MSFFLSKFLWSIINPFNIILFFIFIGIVLHFFLKNKLYKFCYFIALLIFIFIAIMPTGNLLYFQLEKKFHTTASLPSEIDGILILSGATDPPLTKEYNLIHLNGSAERLIESIFLMNKYPKAKVIFSGGSGAIHDQNLTHSYVAKKFYKQLNINIRNIVFESKSRNTYENILYSLKIANPSSDEKWILITSAFHMTRAMNISEKLDWKIIPYAVDFRAGKKFSWKPTISFFGNISAMQSASHEWIGLIAYYFMGRTNKIY